MFAHLVNMQCSILGDNMVFIIATCRNSSNTRLCYHQLMNCISFTTCSGNFFTFTCRANMLGCVFCSSLFGLPNCWLQISTILFYFCTWNLSRISIALKIALLIKDCSKGFWHSSFSKSMFPSTLPKWRRLYCGRDVFYVRMPRRIQWRPVPDTG